jgi:hypothetical protein
MWFILNFYMWFILIFYIMFGRLFSTIVVVVLLSFLMVECHPMVGNLIFIHLLSVAIHETFPEKVLLQFARKGVELGR